MNFSKILTKQTVLWATHIGSLFPAAWLLWDYVMGNLSVNPIQDITFRTGKPALILLILSLAVTPVSSILGLRQVVPARTWLGLYAFFYAAGHFLVFIWLDYGLDWGLLYEAIFEKRYALVGFAALLILLPLALTSTKGWQKRLGKTWKSLHRWVYLAGILAVVHYIWLVKSDIREPLAWGALLGLLLILRLPWVRKQANTLRTRLSGPVKPATKRPRQSMESQTS
ncbi:MAG: protein-methionine-sulfoxide reductase heme-binding subunit MsrQ [Caldilineaceae bacterium]